jgi:SEC-C motif
MLVRSDLTRCVVFIGIVKDGEFLPRATGFLVSTTEHNLHWTHIVTAEHVVKKLLDAGHDIFVRLTDHDGRLIAIGTFGIEHWTFHPNNSVEPADVAVAPLDGVRRFANVPIDFSHENSLVCTPQVFDGESVGLGDEIVIMGLFSSHYGKRQQIPIVRIGHLAALRGEPVTTKYCGPLDAYLVEAMSIGGLSGSPVFVNIPTKSEEEGKLQLGARTWLLGMMHGHFDVKDWNADVETGGVQGAVNSGVGVVIPVEKITETLAHPRLVSLRKEAADKTPPEEPDWDDPCPCGSGRTYGRCHGLRYVPPLTPGQHRMTMQDIRARLDAEMELARRINEANKKKIEQEPDKGPTG